MDEAERRKVCQLIAGIVITDEDLDPTEEAFIDKVLERFGLDADNRDVIFPLVDGDDAAKSIRELPEEARTEAFALLIQAAAADGKVVEEERVYLEKVGEAVGVDSEELERRLEEALRNN